MKVNRHFPPTLYQAIAALIRSQIAQVPEVAIILGSGLSTVASLVEDPVTIPYQTLPYWPMPTIAGHRGDLLVGRWAGKTVAVLCGRGHYYERYTMAELALPVRVLHALGVRRLIVTNAAGGIDPTFHPGDLMLITDHINLVGMAGLSPLRGPNDARLGERFPDMTQAYNPHLANLARRAAHERKIVLREGVYVMLAGPQFETPADIRFLRLIGADAVGMSTVPEVVAAHHAGIHVLGLSGITNVAGFTGSQGAATHEEVLEMGAALGPRMRDLITGVLEQI